MELLMTEVGKESRGDEAEDICNLHHRGSLRKKVPEPHG
jgi:hypothetical protein